jgi:hypothetical protein
VLDTSDAVILLAMAALFEQALCWTEWREAFPQHYDNIVERTDPLIGTPPDVIYAGSLSKRSTAVFSFVGRGNSQTNSNAARRPRARG